MARTTTLSSAGTSKAIELNPVLKATTLMLTVSSCDVATVQIELSLDEPTQLNSPTATWSLLSSATALASSTNVFTNGGMVYTVLGPLGGVRINSSTNAAPTTFTLKAHQNYTA